MSAPIRSRPCGCCVSTRLNRYDTKPFYTTYGEPVLIGKNKCAAHLPAHEEIAAWKKPILFFGKVIGYLRYKTGGAFGRYIMIDKHKNRGYFFWNDVYCNECDKWHFK